MPITVFKINYSTYGYSGMGNSAFDLCLNDNFVSDQLLNVFGHEAK